MTTKNKIKKIYQIFEWRLFRGHFHTKSAKKVEFAIYTIDIKFAINHLVFNKFL